MTALRPAAAVLIGAVSSAAVFGLAFAMVASRPPSASGPSTSRPVIVQFAVDDVSVLATITDPSGQSTLLLSPKTAGDGTPQRTTQNLSLTVPSGATLSVSLQPINASSDWKTAANTSCAIYTDNNGSPDTQLVGRQSIGVIGTSTPPTVCSWTNR